MWSQEAPFRLKKELAGFVELSVPADLVEHSVEEVILGILRRIRDVLDTPESTSPFKQTFSLQPPPDVGPLVSSSSVTRDKHNGAIATITISLLGENGELSEVSSSITRRLSDALHSVGEGYEK